MSNTAFLALADGTIMRGRAIGAEGHTVAEVVFNTAMTGYQEILTDPSYAQQIVLLTYPHIGNTGVNDEDIEANQIFSSGLIVRDVPTRSSNWRQTMTLEEYLKAKGIVAIADIDTRALTRHLRENGAQAGCIATTSMSEEEGVKRARSFPGLAGMDLAKEVTTKEKYQWNEGSWSLEGGFNKNREAKFRIAALDYGVKHNILRLFADRGCVVDVLPAMTAAKEILDAGYDGVFLSNGPGDPEPCDYAINAIREFIEAEIPIFGICLGHQLLALAAGAKTVKMKNGHHGANHPVHDLANKKVMITSQNHGFCVNDDTLPSNIEVTHRSLFDGTIQGIRIKNKPAFGFQGHPEASPGPHDLRSLFDQFINIINDNRAK